LFVPLFDFFTKNPLAMNFVVITYFIYIIVSLVLTVWVANVLFTNGRKFLTDIFAEDIELADAINKLLLVGFYLINSGYMLLTLRESQHILNIQRMIEVLSYKVGIIVLVLGAMHFFNLFILYKMRKRAKIQAALESTYN